MKKYTKTWILSFVTSIAVFSVLIFAFAVFMNYDKKDRTDVSPQTQETPQSDTPDTEEYTDYNDNVGAVSFTEDQITELARNIFYLDGYLNNVKVEFDKTGEIRMGARIKDKQKLVDSYPELEKYSALLGVVENQNISISAQVVEDDGMAKFSITDVNVGGLPIDKGLLEPFIEEDEFSKLFNVSYDSIEIDDGMVVFKQGVPDILDY